MYIYRKSAEKADSNLAEGRARGRKVQCVGEEGEYLLLGYEDGIQRCLKELLLREQLGSPRGLPFGSVAERMLSSQ